MELHTLFRYKQGRTFTFRGGDDVWVFVKGQIKMDLGGRHAAVNGSFSLDSMPGLQPDSNYTFDVFYAERHTSEASIRITTNIITELPSNIFLSVFPNDTMHSGDTIAIVGHMVDQDGTVVTGLYEIAFKIILSVDPSSGSG